MVAQHYRINIDKIKYLSSNCCYTKSGPAKCSGLGAFRIEILTAEVLGVSIDRFPPGPVFITGGHFS